jgi:hypothetical protein
MKQQQQNLDDYVVEEHDYRLQTINDFLVGGTVIKALTFGDGSWEAPLCAGFLVRHVDGREFGVIVQCDPEGNGPGELFPVDLEN